MLNELLALSLIEDQRRTTDRFSAEQAQLRELRTVSPPAGLPARRRALARWVGGRLVTRGTRLLAASAPSIFPRVETSPGATCERSPR